MNEGQKEENIVPIKRWQLKSWQIVILGSIIQSFITYGLAGKLFGDTPVDGGDMVAGFIIMILVSVAISILIGIILTLLLYFKKTQRLGAFLSIAIGIVEIYLLILPKSDIDLKISIVFLGGIASFFLLSAGIYYFWKKV